MTDDKLRALLAKAKEATAGYSDNDVATYAHWHRDAWFAIRLMCTELLKED